MNKNLEIASKIVEEILPDYFTFRLFQSEVAEDGSFFREYAEKPEEIHKRIVTLLESYE